MTRPEARKRGLARAIMAALLEWCGSNGGKQAYLQVEAANVAACSLYASLGFEDLYRYTYWTMPLGEQRIIG
jgi:GNAT superfamily N-acetyltransferase